MWIEVCGGCGKFQSFSSGSKVDLGQTQKPCPFYNFQLALTKHKSPVLWLTRGEALVESRLAACFTPSV